MLAETTNEFDNLAVDVPRLYREAPVEAERISRNENPFSRGQQLFYRLYQQPFLPLRIRNKLWHVLRRSNLDWNWFERFKGYWTDVLGARPLWGPQDLIFLRNLYRIRFQSAEVKELASSKEHLEAWQKPELVYQLLHLVYRELLGNEVKIIDLFRKYVPGNPERVLEYGCATAPVATSIFEFLGEPDYEIHLMDLPTVSLHYAAYKFQAYPQVKVSPLCAEKNLQLDTNTSYDTIFCITVFEHLNEPLETIQRFHSALKPGGLLFFDYIKGEAGGLDTVQGEAQRDMVLDFVSKNFRVLHGKLEKEKSMGLTLVQKLD